MAYIETLSVDESEGELRRAYEAVRDKRGNVTNLFQAHSLRPDTMRAHLDLYLSILHGRTGLSPAEREAIAVTVSAANNCAYCVLRHTDALGDHIKEATLVGALARGEVPSNLEPRLRSILEYVRKLSKQSFAITREDVESLRRAGLSDEEILTTNLTAAYMNFVNRFVDGLGVELEPTTRHSYKY